MGLNLMVDAGELALRMAVVGLDQVGHPYRAYVAIYEAGFVDAKLKELETRVEGKGRMKASILRRLPALEAAATAVTAGPIVLIDVAELPEHDRDAYWSGDDTVLIRYGLPDGPIAPGRVHTLVISIHPETRQELLTTRDMDDGDLEAREQREIREEERREREAKRRKMPVTQVQLPPVPGNAYSPEYNRD